MASGTRNELPIDPRSAFHPNGSAVRSLQMTPVAPHPSAARTIAPDVARVLNVMEQQHQRGRTREDVRASVCGPHGDGDSARRRLDRTDCVSTLSETITVLVGGRRRRASALDGEPFAERRDIDRDSGGERFLDQVLAIEQHSPDRLSLGGLAKLSNEGILPARDLLNAQCSMLKVQWAKAQGSGLRVTQHCSH